MPKPPEMPTVNWYDEPEEGLYATDPDVGIEPPPPEKTFWQLLPHAFIFPLIGKGKYILVVCSFFLAVAILLSEFHLFIFGGFAAFCLIVYVCAYTFSILAQTAAGCDEPPSFPSLSDWWDEILSPLWLFACTLVICLAPAFIFRTFFYDYEKAEMAGILPSIIFEVLRGIGLFYMPMGLLAVSLYDSITGLNPLVIVPSIFKVLPAYLLACAAIAAAMFLPQLLTKYVEMPFLSAMLREGISLYFLMMAMYILGIIYRGYEKRLNWFPTE